MLRRSLKIGIVLALLLTSVASFKLAKTSAEVKAGQMPGDKVSHQSFSTTDGKRFSLDANRGKVVVVQFFGTWCGYSRRQVPSINQLVDQFGGKGLEVVGMAVKDARSNSQLVSQFITDQKVTYPVVGGVDDKYFMGFVDSGDVSVPQTLIYGKDGRLAGHFKGFNQQVADEIALKVSEQMGK